MDSPSILEETGDFAVVFKPPRMHCTVSSEQKAISSEQITKIADKTLLEWFFMQSSSVYNIMHRLDYETHGLVLFAKNEKSYHFFKAAQDNGEFIKEYSALINSNLSGAETLAGFPDFKINQKDSYPLGLSNLPVPFVIESYFRPYDRGRKQVRPVIDDGKKHKEVAKDKGGFYRTEIINVNGNVFTLRIKRGFRHQIRCHLYWIGFPIQNDPLYLHTSNEEQVSSAVVLALRSHALFFPDPANGKQREYRIDALL
jgi:23S rRNA pseudouridine1911/1915/1917 synthase